MEGAMQIKEQMTQRRDTWWGKGVGKEVQQNHFVKK